jgi:hypothetical protein
MTSTLRLAFLAALAAPSLAPAAPADDTREIERVEKALCDAFRDGDAATIGTLED